MLIRLVHRATEFISFYSRDITSIFCSFYDCDFWNNLVPAVRIHLTKKN